MKHRFFAAKCRLKILLLSVGRLENKKAFEIGCMCFRTNTEKDDFYTKNHPFLMQKCVYNCAAMCYNTYCIDMRKETVP